MLDNSGPASQAFAVTPGTSPLAHVTRGVWVGTSGNLVVTMEGGGNDVTFPNVQDGTLLPIRVTHILASGASNIVALW